MAFLDVPARLARVLLELANEEAVIVRRPPQTELPAMTGATRESTNKWLGTFGRIGLIRDEGSSPLLLRPDDLRRRILQPYVPPVLGACGPAEGLRSRAFM